MNCMYTAQGALICEKQNVTEHFINETPNEKSSSVKSINSYGQPQISCTNIFNDINNLKMKYSCENTANINENNCDFTLKCKNT